MNKFTHGHAKGMVSMRAEELMHHQADKYEDHMRNKSLHKDEHGVMHHNDIHNNIHTTFKEND